MSESNETPAENSDILSCEFCAEEFTEDELNKHIGNCQNEPLECDNQCGMIVHRRRLSLHKSDDCVKRLLTCKYCQDQCLADSVIVHYKICPKYPITCPHNCKESKMIREQLESHLESQCPVLYMPCYYKYAGCQFKGTQTAINQHCEENCSSHLLCLANLMNKHRKKSLNSNDKLTEIEEKLASVSTKLEDACEKIIELQKQLTEAETKLVNSENELSDMKNETGIKFEKLFRNCSGIITMEICNLRASLTNKKSAVIKSKSFYSNPFGYHLQGYLYIQLFPFYTRVQWGIIVCRGDYDDFQIWPFEQKITLTILDQRNSLRNSIKRSYTPEIKNPNQRIYSKNQDNDDYGLYHTDQYIYLSDIEDISKDGKSYIKFEVHTCSAPQLKNSK